MTSSQITVPALLTNLDHPVHRNELKSARILTAEIRAAERAGLIAEFRKEFYGPPEIAQADDYRQFVEAIKAYRRLPGIDGLVVAGRTAARLHKLAPLEDRPRAYPYAAYDPFEFHNHQTSARGFNRKAARCTLDDRPRTTVTVEGIEVISIARTLVDVRRRNRYDDSHRGFVALGDRILREARATTADLEAEADLLSGDEAERVRHALTLLDERAQTEAQSRSRLLLADMGLPEPELFADITDDDGTVIATPPFVWPAQRVAGFCEEIDEYCDFDHRTGETGRRAGHPPRACRERDAEDERLRAAGYRVFRWPGDRINHNPCDPCGLRRALTTPLPPRFDDPFAW